MRDSRVVSCTVLSNRLVPIVALISLAFCVASMASAASSPQSRAARFLAIDAGALGTTSEEPRVRFDELTAAFGRCVAGQPATDSPISCLRSVIYGGNGLAIVNDATTLRESTLTGLLLDHRASCAALVALAVAVDDSAWDAYVLRDHVLLRTRGGTPRFLELSDRGREISVRELTNRFGKQLDAAVVVPAERFPAYYLDNLAVRLAKDGRSVDADRLFHKAIELAPKEARPRLNYGTFLLEHGRVDEARRQLKAAVRRAESDADAWTNLGVTWARTGKPDRARDCFERAIQLDPGHQAARTNLAAITPSRTTGCTKPK